MFVQKWGKCFRVRVSRVRVKVGVTVRVRYC